MSSVSPYLLHVNSKPIKVSDELWTEWYTKEHLPDLVSSRTSTRATFYKELPSLLGGDNHPRKFLALYQTDFADCLKTENYTNLRKTSELFPKEGGTPNIQENGDFDARNYELVQEYDPNGIGNNSSSFPQLLTVEMYPQDVEDFEKWYREEHLELMSKVPGFGRCLRYKLGPKLPLTKDEDPPTFLAVYELDDVKKVMGHELTVAAGGTEWSKKHMAESKAFVVRGWERVHFEGA